MGSEAPEFIARGSNGQVEAYSDRVVITRKGPLGYMAQGVRGGRTIYYSEMTGVEYKKPTMLANGYIQFIVTLELASGNKTTMVGTTARGALQDPNTVTLRAFKKKNVEDYERLHGYVMERLREAKLHQGGITTAGVSEADEIRKFKNLLDDGLITQEEFDAKRKELLGP